MSEPSETVTENAPTLDEVADVLVALCQRVEKLEEIVLGDETPPSLGEARRRFLQKTKERKR